MVERWEDVDDVAVELATVDLETVGEMVPWLAAFAGDEPVLMADVRPFPKGEYADPMIELLALAMPLDADRLAFAITGRLTSLNDPIPPVTDDVDLRQRALVVELADGSGGVVRQRSVVHPFDLDAGALRWQPPVHLTDGRGWIADALRHAIQARAELVEAATEADIRAQARRCAALGHGIYLPPATAERLGLADGARP